MRYEQLIRDAWRITWRHPFLWVLGLFAGGTAGASFGGGGGRGSTPVDRSVPGGDGSPEAIALWASSHLGLIAAVVATLVALGLALLAISLIAQGGLSGATADFASGRPSSIGRAWRMGLHLFWRYAALWLLLIAAAMLVGALIAAFVALVVGLTAVVQQSAWVIAPAVVVGLVLLIAGVAAGVIAGIVVPFAQRAIAVQDIGPLAALRDGWQVFRRHPGASLLVWLINLALTLAVGLVITVAMVTAIVVLALPAALIWSAFALTTPTVAYLAVAAVAALGLLAFLVGVGNTFFWSYWTLAYLRLRTDEQPARQS